MSKSLKYVLCVVIIFLSVTSYFAQEIPDDPNHLPIMIGPNPNITGRLKNPVTVAGKITLEGLSDAQERPAIYVVIYTNGKRVERKQVSNSGSYTINSVPRMLSTLIVEINNEEVANFQIIPTISDIIYQDATINYLKIKSSLPKTGVISAKTFYQRSDEHQKLFDKSDDLYKNAKTDEAITILKQLLKLDSKDFMAWTELGNVYFLKNKLSDAEDAYKKALEQNTEFPLAMLNLGRLYLIQMNGEKAIEILTKAIAAEPNSADAQHFLGEAYLFIKKGSKAVSYLNEAIRLSPIGKAEIHLRLATLYNGAGLKDRAALEYKMFLEKVPQYSEKGKLEQYIIDNLPK